MIIINLDKRGREREGRRRYRGRKREKEEEEKNNYNSNNDYKIQVIDHNTGVCGGGGYLLYSLSFVRLWQCKDTYQSFSSWHSSADKTGNILKLLINRKKFACNKQSLRKFSLSLNQLQQLTFSCYNIKMTIVIEQYCYGINEHSRLLLQGQNHVYHKKSAQDYCIIIHSLLFKVYRISKLSLNMIIET